MINTKFQASELNLEHIGWKSYNILKKKAMEQKFSWSGLLISMSIAFFIVIASAQALNIIHHSMVSKHNTEKQKNTQIYRLENIKEVTNSNNFLYTEYIDNEKQEFLPQCDLVLEKIYFI